jgi:hypothetical protein
MEFQVIVKVANGPTKVISGEGGNPFGISTLKEKILQELLIPIDLQRLTTYGGRSLDMKDQELTLEHGQVVSCVFVLCGGKGGFGSMLRSQGAKMKAKGPPNLSACRDLSGRRLKIVEDAKLYYLSFFLLGFLHPGTHACCVFFFFCFFF